MTEQLQTLRRATLGQLHDVRELAERLVDALDYEIEWADPDLGPICLEPEAFIGQVQQHIQAALDLLDDDRDEAIRINDRPHLVLDREIK